MTFLTMQDWKIIIKVLRKAGHSNESLRKAFIAYQERVIK